MNIDENSKKLESIIKEIVEKEDRFLIYDLDISKRKYTYRIKLFIDHPDNATLNDCIRISRNITAAVSDYDDDLKDNFQIEVSTPGIYRDIRNISEFKRFTGKRIKVKLNNINEKGEEVLTVPGKKKKIVETPVFTGTLEIVQDDIIELLTDMEGKLVIPVNIIMKASLNPLTGKMRSKGRK